MIKVNLSRPHGEVYPFTSTELSHRIKNDYIIKSIISDKVRLADSNQNIGVYFNFNFLGTEMYSVFQRIQFPTKDIELVNRLMLHTKNKSFYEKGFLEVNFNFDNMTLDYDFSHRKHRKSEKDVKILLDYLNDNLPQYFKTVNDYYIQSKMYIAHVNYYFRKLLSEMGYVMK